MEVCRRFVMLLSGSQCYVTFHSLYHHAPTYKLVDHYKLPQIAILHGGFWRVLILHRTGILYVFSRLPTATRWAVSVRCIAQPP